MQRDDAYLLDILIAARKALEFAEGMTWETFERFGKRFKMTCPPLSR